MPYTISTIAALLATGALAAPTINFEPRQTTTEPTEFTANPSIALQMLEAAYTCFVTDLGWRSHGLSYNSDSDSAETWYKENIYAVESLSGGAAGVMQSDYTAGLSYLEVVDRYLTDPSVTVHEYGHALTYHARNWVDQTDTGAWWETVANWVADTFSTSELCASAREEYGQKKGTSLIDLQKVIGDSFQVLVDGSVGSGNYYQARPVLTYLTNNPDNVTRLGSSAVWDLWEGYEEGSNETPLHTLSRLLGDTSVGSVIGRYWARMAYVDIGDGAANEVFLQQRAYLTYANLDAQGSGVWRVKADRHPLYMGANINPLKVEGGNVAVSIEADGEFSARLAVRDTTTGGVRYVDLVDGAGEVTVGSGEEASLVVAHTPAQVIQYNPFELSGEVTVRLDYQVTLTGASF
ncbi:hypothetical protein BDV12DRAFT_210679 [Aspergillus spectabilis]